MITYNRIKRNIPAIALFILTFLVYLATLLPGTGYSGDAAKFQLSSRVMGVPHTSGYPAYTIISHVFNLIPVGSPAYRINLMSAFFAAIAVVLLFFIILRLTGNKPVALVSCLLFSVSRTFWSQSVIAEVYTLNASFIAAVLLAMLVWMEKKELKYFFLACFVYAMSFGHHLTMILLVPAIIFSIIVFDYKVILKPVNLLVCAGFFVLAAFQYSYLFMRSYAPAAYVEMWVYTIKDFLWWITGAQFKGNMFSFTMWELISERIPFFVILLKNQFHFTGMIIGLAGACILLRDRIKYALFLLLIFTGNVFFSLNYGIGDIFVFFIPSYIIFTIFIAVGLNAVYKRITAVVGGRKKLYGIFFALLCLLLLAVVISNNCSVANQKKNIWSDEFTDYILENIKDNSVILAPNYAWGQYYLYKIIGEKKRSDVYVHWYWHPASILETYPGLIKNPVINKAEADKFFTGFKDRDKTLRASHVFNREIPAGMNLYFHRETKRIMDRAGFNYRKVVSINKYGHKAEVYEVVPGNYEGSVKCFVLEEPGIEVEPSRRANRLIEKFYRNGCLKIDFTPAGREFLKDGWSRTERNEDGSLYCWADAVEASMVIPIEGTGDHKLLIRVHSLVYSDSPGQWIKLYVNDRFLSKHDLSGDWEKHVFNIPAGYLQEGWNTVKFGYNYTACPGEVLGQEDQRELSVAFSCIKFSRK